MRLSEFIEIMVSLYLKMHTVLSMLHYMLSNSIKVDNLDGHVLSGLRNVQHMKNHHVSAECRRVFRLYMNAGQNKE